MSDMIAPLLTRSQSGRMIYFRILWSLFGHVIQSKLRRLPPHHLELLRHVVQLSIWQRS